MATFKKVLNWLTLIFIFLMPLQTRLIYKAVYQGGSFWEYNSLSIYATEILLGVIALLTIIYLKKLKLKFGNLSKNNILFLVIFFAILFWGIIFAINREVASQKAIFIIYSVLLFFIITIQKLDWQKISWSFIFSSLFQAIFAIIQFGTQQVFGSKYLGMAEQMPQTLGTAVIEINGERVLRAYGTLPHPNILAGFLAISLLVIIAVYFYENKKWFKFLLTGIFIINYFALLLTASRSAEIGFLFALVLIFFFARQKALENLRFAIVNFLWIIIFISIIFTIAMPNFIYNRFQNNARLENISVNERIIGYQDFWQIFKRYWLLGTGLGNYSQALSEIKPNLPAYNYQPVHNAILLPIIELGLMGFLVFIFGCYLSIKFIKNHVHELFNEPKKVINFAITSSLLMMAVFDHWIYSFYFGCLLITFVVIFNFRLNEKQG